MLPRLLGIGGPVLRDSYHLGQTIQQRLRKAI